MIKEELLRSSRNPNKVNAQSAYPVEVRPKLYFLSNNTGLNHSVAKNVKLGAFRRIVKGDSIRVKTIAPQYMFPPSRILDLKAKVNAKLEHVELSWTAPGETLDSGTSYYFREKLL